MLDNQIQFIDLGAKTKSGYRYSKPALLIRNNPEKNSYMSLTKSATDGVPFEMQEGEKYYVSFYKLPTAEGTFLSITEEELSDYSIAMVYRSGNLTRSHRGIIEAVQKVLNGKTTYDNLEYKLKTVSANGKGISFEILKFGK
jgi:hypothetical protein